MRQHNIAAEFIGIVPVFGIDAVVEIPYQFLLFWRQVQCFVDLILEKTIFFDSCMQRMSMEEIFMDKDDECIFFEFKVTEFGYLARLYKGHRSVGVIILRLPVPDDAGLQFF